ncbi:TPA: alanyl-tRNA editing protein [Candidatus Woesearchaeota archaeon]|nr:alanyl-tRNA editing protein [archaeon]HIJ10441.1 alanyl-tRNA editing protein [Candidatus Woesearchaeota archaeon]|tara:strand:- start:178 stop:828 length:651 start_codon:yes stop_codon:yes gene_type:complete
MKKLFWDDPYQTECTATVTEIDGNMVKLDQSIFYAFSGGQLSDEGTIGGITVIEAKKEGDKEDIVDIVYTLEREPDFKVGDTVDVKIDEKRREKLRKLHSAAHIVYYIVIDILGKVKINGSEIQPEKARMDFGYDKPLAEKLPEIEKAVNVFIAGNHDIAMLPDTEKSDLKWWTCNNWKMPCGGTHVKNTTEIGPLRLSRKNKGKGRERIEMYLTE